MQLCYINLVDTSIDALLKTVFAEFPSKAARPSLPDEPESLSVIWELKQFLKNFFDIQPWWLSGIMNSKFK